MNDCVRGDVDQRRAVVVGNDFHPGRQGSVCIHFLDFGLDQRHHIVGVHGAVHDHDRECNVVVMIFARDAEPRRVA